MIANEKKSWAEFRKEKKSRLAEDMKLSSLMAAYFIIPNAKDGESTHVEPLCEDSITTADKSSCATKSKGNEDEEISNYPSPRFETIHEEYHGLSESGDSLMSDPPVMEDASSVITLDQSQTMNDIGFEKTPGICSFARNHKQSQSSKNDVIKENEKSTLHNFIKKDSML